jgi:LAO/AO transport system kinase
MEAAVDRILQGSQLAAARLISLIEDDDPRGRAALKALYPHTGRAFLIGITGPAGAGKSTLVSRMIADLRGRGRRVGVVAVDPSSPFTGGALLGDRIRMQGHETDPGVFIRSMASRGRTGGIARATREAALVMDAMGCEVIIIESVGVGQGEVDIAGCVHLTAVVSVPGMGDEIQAMKAGLLEIADLFIVNKADLPGAEELAATLEGLARLRAVAPGGRPAPVIKTVAARNEGVDALVAALCDQRRRLDAEGRLAERRVQNEFGYLRQLVTDMAAKLLLRESPVIAALREDLRRGAIDPYTAAERILGRIEDPCS